MLSSHFHPQMLTLGEAPLGQTDCILKLKLPFKAWGHNSKVAKMILGVIKGRVCFPIRMSVFQKLKVFLWRKF